MKMSARSTLREPLCKEVNQVNPERNHYMEMLARSTHMDSLCEVGQVNP